MPRVGRRALTLLAIFFTVASRLQRARSRVGAEVAAAYNELYAAITDEANGYADIEAILLHSPDQVKILLA